MRGKQRRLGPLRHINQQQRHVCGMVFFGNAAEERIEFVHPALPRRRQRHPQKIRSVSVT